MEWYWKVIWQVVPYVILIPWAILMVAILRKLVVRLRWRRQVMKEIVVGGPSALLAAIPTPTPFFAKSVALTFPDWSGFAGDVELFSGSDLVARFKVPRRPVSGWGIFVPRFLKEWRGAIETQVEKDIPAGELIARVDGESHWTPSRETDSKRKIILKITVFGRGLAGAAA